MTQVKENEIMNVNKAPAHVRGMLVIDEKEISPTELYQKDKAAFLSMYKRLCWKLNGANSKLDIFHSLLDAMEEAAGDNALEDTNVYKHFSQRSRDSYALTKVNFQLCSREDQERLLSKLQELMTEKQ